MQPSFASRDGATDRPIKRRDFALSAVPSRGDILETATDPRSLTETLEAELAYGMGTRRPAILVPLIPPPITTASAVFTIGRLLSLPAGLNGCGTRPEIRTTIGTPQKEIHSRRLTP